MAIAVAVAALLLAAPESGFGQSSKDGRPEVRVVGVCGGKAATNLRLRAKDGAIELRFAVEHARVGSAWRVVLVHERRVTWRGLARTTRSSGSFEVERVLPDLPGYDTVTARAWGPAGLACRVTATLGDF
ncbi:MAG: hypothetical protein QOE87_3760 [Gaiellales bacterium]|nr:hypothetical protein [Gaiellales bacterium]